MKIPTITVRPIDCGCVLVLVENVLENEGVIAMHLTSHDAGTLAEAFVAAAAEAEARAERSKVNAA